MGTFHFTSLEQSKTNESTPKWVLVTLPPAEKYKTNALKQFSRESNHVQPVGQKKRRLLRFNVTRQGGTCSRKAC